MLGANKIKPETILTTELEKLHEVPVPHLIKYRGELMWFSGFNGKGDPDISPLWDIDWPEIK